MSRIIEISYVVTAGAPDDAHTRCLSWLDSEERARLERFVFPKDRLAFALGRALVRSRLSSRRAVPPDGWRFGVNAFGRPELLAVPELRFNISHCDGMVAAAISTGQDVGVDVENLDRRCSDLTIASSYFAPAEYSYLESRPAEERRAVFLAFWTLKEAYIKARGMGLSIPLTQFSFTLQPPEIAFSAGIDDDPGRWFFWRGNPTASHQLALAAIRSPGEEIEVCCRAAALDSLFAPDLPIPAGLR